MQNVESDKENQNPQHFPPPPSDTPDNNQPHNTNPNDDSQNVSTDTGLGTPEVTDNSASETSRPKFSFASDYTPPTKHYSSLLSSASTASSYNFDSSHSPNVSSFAVLATEYSGSSLAVKPNAIVHPTRRAEETALPENNNNVQDRELSVTGYPVPGGFSITYPQFGRDIRNFADELHRKLGSLSSSVGSYGSKATVLQNVSNQELLSQRPLFITTVPRGVFLPPPKEIVPPLSPSSFRRRQLYAYASHPVVYNATTTTSSFYDQHLNHQKPNSTIGRYTHNNHKIKATNEHQRQHHHAYNQRHTSSTIAKDKYHNSRSNVGAPHNGINTAYGHSNSGGGDSHTVEATVIISEDKDLLTTSIRRRSRLRGTNASSAVTTAAPMAGSISISKEQFQQQLRQHRSKREIQPPEPYKNIMYDKRVVRGSNFANPLLGEYDPFDKAAEFRRRHALRKKCKNQRNVLGTPPPVAGRKHEDVQTDRYLEELVTKPSEYTVETQTDLFLEKPPTPPYIPAKVGIDRATEILDGELFQFDAEAEAIIDVLVDNTMELSILEVAHEKEIEIIRQRQAELLAQREVELAELRRLEQEEIRLQAEKERRLRQDSIAKNLDNEMQREITAAKLLQGHISSILPEILDNIEPATDAAKKDKLMEALCPWLSAEVAKEVGHIIDSREILTVLIHEIIKQRAEVYAGYREDEPEPSKADTGEEEHEATEMSCETESEFPVPRCPPDAEEIPVSQCPPAAEKDPVPECPPDAEEKPVPQCPPDA